MLARERMLHVAECWRGRRVGHGAIETRAGAGVARPKRGEPALRFLLETLDTAQRTIGHTTFLHGAWCPLTTGRKKVYDTLPFERVGGSIPLPRTGGAPMRANRNSHGPAHVRQARRLL